MSRLLLAAAVLLLAACGPAPAGPAADALAAQVAGVAPADAAYPRQGEVLRERAWLRASPGQPAGVALVADAPDAVFGRERIIAAADLRAALALVRGRHWDEAAQAWTGSGPPAPLAEVRRLLVAALPTPAEAELVIDLLLGEPAAGVPDLAGLLLAEPPGLTAIRVVPFSGQRGRLLIDRGRSPYHVVERPYQGLVVAFTGAGWPAGWRVIRLESREE